MSRRQLWIVVVFVAAVLLAGGQLAQRQLLVSRRHRLSQQYIRQLALLSERDAAQFVRSLATNDDPWLEVIVAASCDERPALSSATASELTDLVDRWGLTADKNSVLAAQLATLLAQRAPALPAERRHLARALAQRLIAWPVDSKMNNASKFIADCQTVLLLPVAEPAEIRVASASRPGPAASPVTEPQAETQPMEPAIQQQPPPSLPGEPQKLDPQSVRRISDS